MAGGNVNEGGGIDPKVEELVQSLADDVHLRLSSDSRLTKRFHALIRTAFPLKGSERHGTSYLLQYDEGRMGILVVSDTGLPSCYMTNGFIVAFDPVRRGQLLLHEGGHPSQSLTLEPGGERASCTVQHETRAKIAVALVDLSSVLAGLLGRAIGARQNEVARSIEITTPRALASICLPGGDDPETYPVDSVAVTTGGQSVAVGPIGLHSTPSARVLGVTLDEIKGTGIPVNTVNAEAAGRIDMTIPLGFGDDAAEQNAAKELMQVFARVGGERE